MELCITILGAALIVSKVNVNLGIAACGVGVIIAMLHEFKIL